MHLSIEKKIRIGFILAMVLLLLIGGIGYFSAQRAMVTYHSVDHSHQVMDQLGEISVGILNAEAAARDFALRGDESLLRLHQSGLATIASGSSQLRQLIKESPDQLIRLNALEGWLTAKISWQSALIEERRIKGFQAVSKKLTARQTPDAMEQIRIILAQISSAERRLLDARSARAKAEARTLTSVVLLGSLLAVGLVGIAGLVVQADFRKRRRAEEERDRFFNLSRDLLCIASFEGYFKNLNPVWEQVLGYSRKELMAGPFLEFVHPEDRARTLNEAGRLVAGGEVVFFENRYRRKDGAWRWLSWSARSSVPARTIYATARDITEQKQAAEQIVQLNQELSQRASQLEAANRELEAFSYSVSHDLRAPLRHISGFVDLLKKHSASVLAGPSVRYLDFIAGAVKQMGRLVDDLLGFSRMARSELRHTRVSLKQLVMEVQAELSQEWQGRQVEWVIGALPELQADMPMLRVALSNLLSNAVKYTRQRPHAKIEVGQEPHASEHVIFVRDNGVGFDMKYASKLFGVFQRLHSEDEFEGTGIGLANVRRIILRHGGRVWAEAREDQGATFYFALPRNPVTSNVNSAMQSVGAHTIDTIDARGSK